jgi:TonB family protein
MSAFYLNIQYPPAARRKGIEGRLELRFTVGADGTVRGIQVAKSLHPLCDSAAVRALRSVRFAPGTHNGEPIPVRMSLPVRFTLRTTPPSLTKTTPHTPSG